MNTQSNFGKRARAFSLASLLIAVLLVALLAPALAFAEAGQETAAQVEMSAAPQGQVVTGTTIISLNPVTAELAITETATMEVMVEDATDVFGFEFELTFDSAIVDVVDADGGIPGVQITAGDLFSGKNNFEARNEVITGADGVSDTVRFSIALVGGAEAISGSGSLATIEWSAVSTGTSDLTFTTVNLSDSNGSEIATDAQAGQVTVGSTIVITNPITEPVTGTFTGTVTGTLTLQSRSDYSGIDVFLLEEACPVVSSSDASVALIPDAPQAITDVDGNFTISGFDGKSYQCLRAVEKGFLTAQYSLPSGGDTIGLAPLMLLGGDSTGDNLIDIFDLAYIASRYEESDESADINGDGIIDIFDLVVAASNYEKSGPLTWE